MHSLRRDYNSFLYIVNASETAIIFGNILTTFEKIERNDFVAEYRPRSAAEATAVEELMKTTRLCLFSLLNRYIIDGISIRVSITVDWIFVSMMLLMDIHGNSWRLPW